QTDSHQAGHASGGEERPYPLALHHGTPFPAPGRARAAPIRGTPRPPPRFSVRPRSSACPRRAPVDAGGAGSRGMCADHVQEVRLRLMRPNDMFEMPQTDLFSEYRNFLTGMELCLSELRANLSRRPVRLVIELPPAEITDELPDRFTATLHRYCDHRL